MKGINEQFSDMFSYFIVSITGRNFVVRLFGFSDEGTGIKDFLESAGQMVTMAKARECGYRLFSDISLPTLKVALCHFFYPKVY